MKQARLLSEVSCLSKFTLLYPISFSGDSISKHVHGGWFNCGLRCSSGGRIYYITPYGSIVTCTRYVRRDGRFCFYGGLHNSWSILVYVYSTVISLLSVWNIYVLYNRIFLVLFYGYVCHTNGVVWTTRRHRKYCCHGERIT